MQSLTTRRQSLKPSAICITPMTLLSWCVGHLVSPMDAGGYDERFKKWRYDDLPILPEPFRYVLAPGKEDAFENLRALMNRPDVDTIVNACDVG